MNADNFLYLGRQYNFPVALEGALKLKEISYIHAEGYPAAEMKHGPIALVDEHTPSVFLIPQGLVYDKVMSNLEEIKARGGPVIAVMCEGDTRVTELADDVITVPAVGDFLQPVYHGPAAATFGVSHRRPPRLRCGQASQSGEERDSGIVGELKPSVFLHCPPLATVLARHAICMTIGATGALESRWTHPHMQGDEL